MKKFRELILAGIDEDITGTNIEKLCEVKRRFESEMIYNNRIPSFEICREWLQGLCSTVHIPWENYAILEWIESQVRVKRKLKQSEESYFIARYWDNAAKTLYEMLYN